MKMSRVWAMPPSGGNTFECAPIREFVLRHLEGISVDPFARNSRLANWTNDPWVCFRRKQMSQHISFKCDQCGALSEHRTKTEWLSFEKTVWFSLVTALGIERFELL